MWVTSGHRSCHPRSAHLRLLWAPAVWPPELVVRPRSHLAAGLLLPLVALPSCVPAPLDISARQDWHTVRTCGLNRPPRIDDTAHGAPPSASARPTPPPAARGGGWAARAPAEKTEGTLLGGGFGLATLGERGPT